MMADNNLESFAIPNLQQMAQVGSSASLRIVVEVDRSMHYSTEPIGNIAASASTKRLFVQQGSFQQIQDLGNLDTGDPATLADFIQWGVATYPAQNYALVLWDHGGSWQAGFGLDETSGHGLGLPKLKQALTNGLAAAGVGKLQILGFDACLMSTFEVMEALSPYASYLIASEEVEPGAGWDYSRLQPAHDTTSVETVTLAKGIVDGYAALNATDGQLTLAVTDLSALSQVATAISNFSAQKTPKMGALAVDIARVRAGVLEFGKDPNPARSFNMVDVGDLWRLLAQVNPTDFAALKTEMDAALANAVLYRKAGLAAGTSTGISIFFPPTKDVYDAAAYGALGGLQAWRTFLEAFLSAGATAAVPTFADHAATVTGTTTLTISAPLSPGASLLIASAELLFGYSFPSSPGVTDEIDFYGDRPATWDANSATATWNKTVARFTQGVMQDWVYLSVELRAGSTAAAVIPLAYLPPLATTCATAGVGFAEREILFDTTTGVISSDKYFMFVNGTVSELRPQLGSHFLPLTYVLLGTQNFTHPPTNQGWFCVGQALAADQVISLDFAVPSLSAGIQLAFDIRIANPGGKGDGATNVGTY